MKSFGIASSLAVLASLASASPTPSEWTPKALLGSRTIAKRADITDACDIGFASGTTGGAGGTTTTVSSLADFTAAAEADGPAVVVLDGEISGDYQVRVGSDKSIIGLPGASLENVGLYINKQDNVIVRNLKISKVVDANGDAIGIQESTNVWVDHCDLSSDLDSGKDFYDGLIDVTRASDFITISNTFLHDHFKASLIGHTDSNDDQDEGKFHVTYANNHWKNTNSRNPSVRFGTVHIVNNFYEDLGDTGVNARMGAEVLIESSVFDTERNAIVWRSSPDTGFVVVDDVVGADDNEVEEGSLTSVPYTIPQVGSGDVESAVVGVAGQTLTFDGSSSGSNPGPIPDETEEEEQEENGDAVESPVESTPSPVESSPVPIFSQPAEETEDDEEFVEVCTRRRALKNKAKKNKARSLRA